MLWTGSNFRILYTCTRTCVLRSDGAWPREISGVNTLEMFWEPIVIRSDRQCKCKCVVSVRSSAEFCLPSIVGTTRCCRQDEDDTEMLQSNVDTWDACWYRASIVVVKCHPVATRSQKNTFECRFKGPWLKHESVVSVLHLQIVLLGSLKGSF